MNLRIREVQDSAGFISRHEVIDESGRIYATLSFSRDVPEVLQRPAALSALASCSFAAPPADEERDIEEVGAGYKRRPANPPGCRDCGDPDCIRRGYEADYTTPILVCDGCWRRRETKPWTVREKLGPGAAKKRSAPGSDEGRGLLGGLTPGGEDES